MPHFIDAEPSRFAYPGAVIFRPLRGGQPISTVLFKVAVVSTSCSTAHRGSSAAAVEKQLKR
jgi:hypothetical protein